MEDGLYLVCPKCGEINKGKGWSGVIYREYYLGYVSVDDEKNKVDTGFEITLDTGFREVTHSCGFKTNSYSIDDFTITVKNDIVTKVGNYWIDHPDELENIVSKYGLKLVKK